jgi:hypothetical protein
MEERMGEEEGIRDRGAKKGDQNLKEQRSIPLIPL